MGTHYSSEQSCVSRTVVVVTVLEECEKEEGVMSSHVYILPLQNRSGYELVP